MQHLASAGGARTVRTQVVEERRDGQRWTTELTVHEGGRTGAGRTGDGETGDSGTGHEEAGAGGAGDSSPGDGGPADGWVWLDVLAPEAAPATRTPRLAGALLDVLDARDGGGRLGAAPRVLVGPGEVDALVDALADERRRGLTFVAPAPPTTDLPTWGRHVTALLERTRGLASGYVLDAEAAALFTTVAGAHHGVTPGTVRTFHPRVVLGDRADGLRHRILSAERMTQSPTAHLAAMLGRRAGDVARSAPLPEPVRALDRVLRAALDERLVADARPPRRPSPLDAASGPGASLLVERRAASEQDTRQALGELMASVSGEEQVTRSAVEALAALVRQRREESASAPGQDAAIDQLQARIADLEAGIDRATAQRLEALRRCDDEQVERAIAEQDLAGTAARKAWEAILALDDYAARSAAGLCSSDVDGYLQETPAGCHGFSAARHARSESEDVRRNRRYAAARVLPVPPEVDPSGCAQMWAHFKLTQSGMTSPRLHYHDATATTGTVYVGYLGPHLPTGATN